ncbi:MAG TPA: hypothetical protein VEC13_01170, partial [Candidatus Paceibacterota bacterium]|nr:hypothetical protein [Candidatus Paceibacterota bacterium]
MNSNLAKTIRAILYATPVVLLFVSGNMFFPYIATKGLLFRLLVEIALALYLFLIFKDRSFLPKKSALLIALSAFTGIVLIADIFSAHFSFAFWSNFERMEGFILILHLFIYFVLLGSVF